MINTNLNNYLINVLLMFRETR